MIDDRSGDALMFSSVFNSSTYQSQKSRQQKSYRSFEYSLMLYPERARSTSPSTAWNRDRIHRSESLIGCRSASDDGYVALASSPAVSSRFIRRKRPAFQ